MNKAKYIVARIGNNEYMMCFPSLLVHRQFAGAIHGLLLGVAGNGKVTYVAAGAIDPGTGECSGESETMQLQSRGVVDQVLFKTSDLTRMI